MRAIYLAHIHQCEDLKEFFLDSKYYKEKIHHLLTVIRLKEGDEVLFLSGMGLAFLCKTENLSKKGVLFKVIERKEKKRSYEIDLGILVPKKESFELCIKTAVELGIREILPFKSSYSDIHTYNSLTKSKLRFEHLIESSLIQSNNYFYPLIHEGQDFEKLLDCAKNYKSVFYFSSRELKERPRPINVLMPALMIIGPEGGLCPDEERLLEREQKLMSIHLPSPLLRTPTALSAAMGFMLGKL